MQKISIILPVRRSPEKTIESIKKHTKDYELVVVDREAGFAEKLNEGIRRATGEYLAFLHDDCEVCEGWLDDLPRKIGAFHLGEFSGKMWIWGGYYPEGYCTNFTDGPDYTYFLCLNRKTLEEIGKLDEWYQNPWCQDVDMGMQIKKAGFSIRCLEGKVIHHQKGGKRLSENEQYLKKKWGL